MIGMEADMSAGGRGGVRREGRLPSPEELYRESAGFVYNVALRVSGDPYVAEEATQETFIKAFRALGGFGERSSVRTWLYRIAVNTALDIARRRSREHRRTAGLDEEAAERAAGPDEPARGAERSCEREAVQRLLDALPEDQRACLVLRELEGLSYREIADVLSLNINTVRTRLKRARERLVERAGKEAGDGL